MYNNFLRMVYSNIKTYDVETIREFALWCAIKVMPIYEKNCPNDLCVRNCINVMQLYLDKKATIENLDKSVLNVVNNINTLIDNTLFDTKEPPNNVSLYYSAYATIYAAECMLEPSIDMAQYAFEAAKAVFIAEEGISKCKKYGIMYQVKRYFQKIKISKLSYKEILSKAKL